MIFKKIAVLVLFSIMAINSYGQKCNWKVEKIDPFDGSTFKMTKVWAQWSNTSEKVMSPVGTNMGVVYSGDLIGLAVNVQSEFLITTGDHNIMLKLRDGTIIENSTGKVQIDSDATYVLIMTIDELIKLKDIGFEVIRIQHSDGYYDSYEAKVMRKKFKKNLQCAIDLIKAEK